VVADAVAVARADVVVPVDKARAAQVDAVASDEVDDHDVTKKIQVLSSAS
jgi:hypothetical protein